MKSIFQYSQRLRDVVIPVSAGLALSAMVATPLVQAAPPAAPAMTPEQTETSGAV